jgi:hypothetical protein
MDLHTLAYLGLAAVELAAGATFALEGAAVHAAIALAAAALHALLCRHPRPPAHRRRRAGRKSRIGQG